ncbi:uncharacterized protein F4822DRAFT_404808 [Hypoxylon trugodes]|uniref:uncharacterized protein n=1 Tax=Hypoxylon trugodes TaxID=326681 RepID=UPI002192A9D4|nr:uncharacterized protein F4822DRAFT_404808 [Hypoxylon trugodes]KAI1389051.1 hypothetical protein F4822DRAFT_404808 [Hypoxylon trugodes]
MLLSAIYENGFWKEFSQSKHTVMKRAHSIATRSGISIDQPATNADGAANNRATCEGTKEACDTVRRNSESDQGPRVQTTDVNRTVTARPTYGSDCVAGSAYYANSLSTLLIASRLAATQIPFYAMPTRRLVQDLIDATKDHISTMSGRYRVSPTDFDLLYQLYQEDTSAKGLYEFIIDHPITHGMAGRMRARPIDVLAAMVGKTADACQLELNTEIQLHQAAEKRAAEARAKAEMEARRKREEAARKEQERG